MRISRRIILQLTHSQNPGLSLVRSKYVASVFRIHVILVWIRICGSMPLTNGSGFGSGCGSGSCYFRHWPSRRQQKTNLKINVFLLITFWRYIYIIFQRKKVQKKSQNSRNQGVSYYFCLMIEGSGSIPPTSGFGSGSGRPKNMWIRNTALHNIISHK